MGLDMSLSIMDKKTNETISEESCYWGREWPIFFWFENALGEKIINCEYHIVSKEVLIKLRDTCITALQKATDGSKITDLTLLKKLFYAEDKSIDDSEYEYFIGVLIYTLNDINRMLYYVDLDSTTEVRLLAWW